MIKGIIFDYGGTLDTDGCHWGKMLWHAYESHHIPITEQQFRDAYVFAERTLGQYNIILPTYTFRKTLDIKLRLEMENLCTTGAWDAHEEEFHAKHDEVLNDLYEQVKDITNRSRVILEELCKEFKMVLVSNFYGNIRIVLKEFGLEHLFRDVVESATVGIRKPNARIFSIGLEKLGLLPQEVVVVGDSYYKDILPAVKVGCHTIWLKGEGWTDTKYDETVPSKIITTLKELTVHSIDNDESSWNIK